MTLSNINYKLNQEKFPKNELQDIIHTIPIMIQEMDTLRKKNIVSQYMKHILKLNTMKIQFIGKILFIKQNIIMKLINGSMNVVLKHLEKIKILTGEI